MAQGGYGGGLASPAPGGGFGGLYEGAYLPPVAPAEGAAMEGLLHASFPSEADTLAYVDALKHSNFSQWRSLEEVAKRAGGGSCSGVVNTSVLTALYLLGLFNLCAASPASCCRPLSSSSKRRRRSSNSSSVEGTLSPLLNGLQHNLSSLSLEPFNALPHVTTPDGGRIPIHISVVEEVRKLWDSNPRLLSNIPCSSATASVRSSFISLSGVASGIILAYSIAQLGECYPDHRPQGDENHKIWFFPIPKANPASKSLVRSLPTEIPVTGEDDPDDGCGRQSVRMKDGRCAHLLSSDQCPFMHWVLMDRDTLQGECIPRVCPDGKVFVEADQMCHSIDEPDFCPEGQRLFLTAWGEAVCDCLDGMFHGADGKCHRLYEPAYCDEGTVFQFHRMTKALTCKVDPCHEKNQLRQPKDLPFARAPRNGVCYRLGSNGPCIESQRFGFDIEKLSPSCISLREAGLERPQRSFQYSHMSFPTGDDEQFPHYEVSYVILNGSTWELMMRSVGRQKREVTSEEKDDTHTVVKFIDTSDFPDSMDEIVPGLKEFGLLNEENDSEKSVKEGNEEIVAKKKPSFRRKRKKGKRKLGRRGRRRKHKRRRKKRRKEKAKKQQRIQKTHRDKKTKVEVEKIKRKTNKKVQTILKNMNVEGSKNETTTKVITDETKISLQKKETLNKTSVTNATQTLPQKIANDKLLTDLKESQSETISWFLLENGTQVMDKETPTNENPKNNLSMITLKGTNDSDTTLFDKPLLIEHRKIPLKQLNLTSDTVEVKHNYNEINMSSLQESTNMESLSSTSENKNVSDQQLEITEVKSPKFTKDQDLIACGQNATANHSSYRVPSNITEKNVQTQSTELKNLENDTNQDTIESVAIHTLELPIKNGSNNSDIAEEMKTRITTEKMEPLNMTKTVSLPVENKKLQNIKDPEIETEKVETTSNKTLLLNSTDKERVNNSDGDFMSGEDIPMLPSIKTNMGRKGTINLLQIILDKNKLSRNSNFSSEGRDIHPIKGITKINQEDLDANRNIEHQQQNVGETKLILNNKRTQRKNKGKRRRQRKRMKGKRKRAKGHRKNKKNKTQSTQIAGKREKGSKKPKSHEKESHLEAASQSLDLDLLKNVSLPFYLRNRDRRQAKRNKAIPGIINAPLLNQCRPGAKRDYNGHCRPKVIPESIFSIIRIKPRRPYAPTYPRIKCSKGTRLDSRGVCRQTFSGLG